MSNDFFYFGREKHIQPQLLCYSQTDRKSMFYMYEYECNFVMHTWIWMCLFISYFLSYYPNFIWKQECAKWSTVLMFCFKSTVPSNPTLCLLKNDGCFLVVFLQKLLLISAVYQYTNSGRIQGVSTFIIDPVRWFSRFHVDTEAHQPDF